MDGKDNLYERRWFVMRDLKRTNAKVPAYLLLSDHHLEIFTPMKWKLITQQGKKVRKQVPFMQDLLFVHETRARLDPFVQRIPTLQYRYLRNTYREPMTVPFADMVRFIQAVGASDSPRYYLPEEVTPAMHGRSIRIVGGPLDGCEGNLLTTRGSKVKRLLVELPGILSVGVEVSPEYIQLIKKEIE